MKNRLIDISIISAGVAFLCWYLPVAFNNVFACDDYWFGSNVRDNGLFGNVLFYYYNWEGSYTHTFLASWPLAFHFSRMPFVGNMFSILLFYSALLAFFKTYTDMVTKRCLMYSLYFVAFAYLCTKGNSEIRFWICANVTYLSEVSFVLILFSLYHVLYKEPTLLRWLLLGVFAFFVGGSKLTVILYSISGLVIHDILFKRTINRVTLITIFLISVFVAINIAAPGNYIRLDVETINKDGSGYMTVWESVLYRFIEMKSYVLNTLFLLPIATRWNNKCMFDKKRVWVVIAIIFITYVLDGIIMYICFNDSGPLRVYFIAEVFAALAVLFMLNHFYNAVLRKYNSSVTISILFAIMVAVSNFPMMLQVNDSIEYSRQARERDRYVASYTTDDTIKINRLPDSYLMLSYFANDVIWLKNVYLPYFQKENRVVLVDSDRTEER